MRISVSIFTPNAFSMASAISLDKWMSVPWVHRRTRAHASSSGHGSVTFPGPLSFNIT